MVFIDGSNLLFSLIDNQFQSRNFNYSLFVNELVGSNRRLIRAYYYDAPIKQSGNKSKYQSQQKFFDRLKRLDYLEVRLGRIQNGHQKGVDVKIAVDMINFAVNNLYDTAILVSGDSDLVPAVESVKALGKHVELAFFDKCHHLRNICDVFNELNSTILNKCYN